MDNTADNLRSLADKINFLFDTVRPPRSGGGGGNVDRPYSNAEVARATGISETHIGYLRNGRRDNPGRDVLQAIARFFRVSASFLVDADPEQDDYIAAQVRLAAVLRNEQVRLLAFRLIEANPSTETLNAIRTVVEEVLRVEATGMKAPRRRRPPGPS
jgi:transcriptional regulator with XRE-family HTH domain